MPLCVATSENNLQREREREEKNLLCALNAQKHQFCPPLQTKHCLSASWGTQQLSLDEQFVAPWQTQWGPLSTVSFLSEDLQVVCGSICSIKPVEVF